MTPMADLGYRMPREGITKTRLRREGERPTRKCFVCPQVVGATGWKWIRRDISCENERNREAISTRTNRLSCPTYSALER